MCLREPPFPGVTRMKGDRKRNAVKPDYVNALGLAAFCFASCEWQVVWCCEKILPGSLGKIVDDKMLR
jgi:hypothetical protein